jgi:hypothetical protein
VLVSFVSQFQVAMGAGDGMTAGVLGTMTMSTIMTTRMRGGSG